MGRVAAALDHAENHREPSGPVALCRTEPDTYTVTARLHQLTPEQPHRLGQAQLYRHPLTAGQAHMLLATLAFNNEPDRYLDHREAHRDAERDLNVPAWSTPTVVHTGPASARTSGSACATSTRRRATDMSVCRH